MADENESNGSNTSYGFRKALLHLSHKLSSEDVKNLRFNLSNFIDEDKQCGIEIFKELMHLGKLDVSKRDLLGKAFVDIGRTDLAKLLEGWNDSKEIPCKCTMEEEVTEFVHEDGECINMSKKHILDDIIVKKLSLVESADDVEKINLSDNSVGPGTLQYLVERFRNVKDLNLRRCKLSKPELIEKVTEAITKLPKLEYVDLFENNLGDTGVECLLPHLRSAPHLKGINCGKNKVTTKGLEAVGRKISTEDITLQLRTLGLASNKMNGESFHALQEILTRLPNLEEFDIAHNNLGSSVTDIILYLPKTLKKLSLIDCRLNETNRDCLSKALQELPNLIALNLGDNELKGIETANIVTPLLHKNKQFEEIRLYNCKILSDGMIALGPSLCQLTCLTTLTLSKNFIKATGAKALSEALPNLKGLTQLYLSDNELYDKGLIVLVNALEKLAKLKILALNNNHISDVGAKELAEPLRKLVCLQTLYLYDNMIGDSGIIAILDSLMNAPDLEKLILNSNVIEDEGIRHLIELVNTANMKKLKEIFVHKNSFSDFKPELQKLSRKHGIMITM